MLAVGDKVKVVLAHNIEKVYQCEVVSLPDIPTYPYWEFKIKAEWMDGEGAHSMYNLWTVTVGAIFFIDKVMNGGYG